MGGGGEGGKDKNLHRKEGPAQGFEIYIGFRYIKTGLKRGGGGQRGCRVENYQIYSDKAVRENDFSLIFPLLKFLRFESSQAFWNC